MLNVEDLSIKLHSTARNGGKDRQEIRLVRDVSFSIPDGETMALMGETGAGKTVTALALLGLLPTYFTVTGSARLNGQELIGANGMLGRKLFMVLQDAATSLNPSMTILKQLREVTDMPHVRKRLGTEKPYDAIIRTLEEVGINDPQARVRSYPHEFSGGMRQRVAIAMALLAGPELLVADEPTSALDILTQHSVLGVLRDVQQRHGMMTLFVSHGFRSVVQLCDRVAVMYAGRLVEQDKVSEVLAAPLHPYTRLLRESVPALGEVNEVRDQNLAEPPSIFNLDDSCPFVPRCDRSLDRCAAEFPPAEAVPESRTVYCWNRLPVSR